MQHIIIYKGIHNVMKKFTLMMLAVLATLSTFAQSNEPKPVELTWRANSMGWDNAQEVTAFNLAADLTATVAKGSGSNAPKYYTTGDALRLYAGNTITLQGAAITRIEFVMTGEEKQMRLEGDGYDNGVWTGQADAVTLNVPSTSGSQARIQRIIVHYTSAFDPADVQPAAPTEPVALPENAEPLSYMLTAEGEASTEEGSTQPYSVKQTAKVAFFGNDVYVQGLSYYFPEAWVKGSISGNKATFSSPQLYGTDDEGAVYFMGYDFEADKQTDVVFDYDPEERTLTCNSYILENGYPDELGYFAFFTYTHLAPGSNDAVELPEGLEAKEYHFKGYEAYYEQEEEFPVYVAFDNADVYVQGLSTSLPEAWVKGTLSDGVVTFDGGQYMGSFETVFGDLDLYFSGATFLYDAETGILSAPDGYTTETDQFSWDEYAYSVLTPTTDGPATPLAPAISGIEYDDEYGYFIHLDIPLESTDGQYLQSSKLSYQLFYNIDGDVKPYVFTTSDYENIEAEMTAVPYNYTDDWDIYTGGATIYLYGDVMSWKRIGIQSIYTGGGETHSSTIVWVDMTTLGISTATTTATTQQYFDLQGRHASSSRHGLTIVRSQQADGTVTVKKVVR